jgi:secreted PhoX family phosphatase
MALDLTRRRFVEGSAAAGTGLALSGSLSALAAQSAQAQTRPRARGYGELVETREEGSDAVLLALPNGFMYRVISRSGDPMTDGNPTPNTFDGMAAYPGHGGSTILVRNHEQRSRPGEIPVVVPSSKRYDPDVNVRGGNTKLVVGSDRALREHYAVLGGTHTNCAGGWTPWRTWITSEEIFNYGSVENNVTPGTGVPHGYNFEVPADATRPVTPLPIIEAGRFSHEAVAWFDGILYETEDRGDACFYRFTPARQPKEYGDLAAFGGTLEALVISGRPNFDANTANPRERYGVEWVTIDDPNPLTDTVRAQAQAKGAAIFDRTEGIWTDDRRIYFDCTTGGEAQLGQLWELRPRRDGGGELTLVYESSAPDDLQNPDNLVVVPATGHVFLQEDGDDEQYVRGVTRRGRIYDFARTTINQSEFCGGCFSPDGRTFFLNQQGSRPEAGGDPLTQPDSEKALTYAIWGPFEAAG